MTAADEFIALMSERGGAAYFGEPVSQQEHALQAAWLAREAGARPALVAAALLHDVGHLLHGGPEDIADHGVDALHELAGYEWVRARFGDEIAAPVRHHVAAKRYLCLREPGYYERLSPASKQSLALQGGIFSEEQAREFESRDGWQDAVLVRKWDDAAKVPGLDVPALESYRELLHNSSSHV
jgi:gamma-butyrobetaine dioxygenase